MEKISIVIPVYNSERSLEELNNEIDSYFSKRHYDVEKIFVDDASDDASFSILSALAKKNQGQIETRVLRLARNAGQQNALFCGLHHVSGDYIVTMDDDLQHDVKYIEEMIQKIKAGADLVYGVHETANAGIRSSGSKLTALFFRKTFPQLKGKRVSSFRCFKREDNNRIIKCQYPFIYLSALLLRDLNKIENIQVVKRNRPYGQSGYNVRKLMILFLKLHFYYGKWLPEYFKPIGAAYEEANDSWGS